MKGLILLGALLIPAVASAELVYVQAGKGHQCAGDTFQIGDPMEVLFPNRACALPIANAREFRAYRLRIKGSDEPGAKHPELSLNGCWSKLVEGSYYVIRQDGSQSTLPPNAYVSASLLGSGVATVIRSPTQGSAYAKAVEMCP